MRACRRFNVGTLAGALRTSGWLLWLSAYIRQCPIYQLQVFRSNTISYRNPYYLAKRLWCADAYSIDPFRALCVYAAHDPIRERRHTRNDACAHGICTCRMAETATAPAPRIHTNINLPGTIQSSPGGEAFRILTKRCGVPGRSASHGE